MSPLPVWRRWSRRGPRCCASQTPTSAGTCWPTRRATSSARSPSSSGRLAPGRRRLSASVWGSAHVDRRVVEDERGLQLVVLGAGELQRDLLPGVAAQREAVLGVPGVVVEVGVGG